MYDPRPQHLQHTANGEVEQFCKKLESFGRPCGFLHVITPTASIVPSTTLPLIPRSVQERVLVCMRDFDHPLSLAQIYSLERMFIDRITPDSQQAANNIEKATQKQFLCKRWHEERHCRITAGEIMQKQMPNKHMHEDDVQCILIIVLSCTALGLRPRISGTR